MTGRVTLLGAGPGNPEYLTLLGKRRLQAADVVLYDRLVNPSLLAFAPQAEKIDVGKLPQHHKVKQSQTNQLLVELAQAGKQVVRLKAGDPYVFGRGGEEGQILAANHVAFEVVPGLTSAIAGLAAAGIPITHRAFASSFHVITGHRKADGQELDWAAISQQEGTLVFLMGMEQLTMITQQLVAHGREANTPVAVIQWATQWRQRQVTGTLTTIVAEVAAHHIGAPALIVVGGVVSLAKTLQVSLPLQGRHLLVPYSPQSRLTPALQDAGADVDVFDKGAVTTLTPALPDWSQLTSLVVDDGASYQVLLTALMAQGQDQRVLAPLTLVAVNGAVARGLKAYGLSADLIADGNQAVPTPGVEIGPEGQFVLPETPGLQRLALTACQLPVPMPTRDLTAFDAVIFPSQRAVRAFVSGLTAEQRPDMAQLTAFCMGPRIHALAAQSSFARVIETPKSIEQTVAAIRKEYAHE